jgi:hypothetical protein
MAFISIKPWFDHLPQKERRLAQNALKRAAITSAQQDESQIQRWLDLGDQALKDDRETHIRALKARSAA